jgi:hypothetical protein
MQPFFIMKKLDKGCSGSFGTHYSISIISCGKNILDLRPTSVTTSPRERIEFVSQGPTVYFLGHLNSFNMNRQEFNRCSGLGQVAGTCECGNLPSDSTKCWNFLDQLRTGQLLKKDSAPWSE